MNKVAPVNVDAYISVFPKETQKLLEQVRTAIKKAAPKAEEVISYQMPAYKFQGMLVYFAGYKNHIGFYPTSSGISNFKKELSKYKTSKGAVQFPIGEPMPISLITKITKFRIQENLEKAEAKSKKVFVKTKQGFLSSLPAPARRALENSNINSIKKLSTFTEAEILSLHGMGPGSMPKLRNALKAEGLSFKKSK